MSSPTVQRTIKPLRPHPNGQWYVPMRINGRRVSRYFGKIGEGDDRGPSFERAQQAYLRYLGAAAEGRQPLTTQPSEVTVLELVDRFVTFQEDRLRSGDIQARHFADQRRTVKLLLDWAGPHAIVEDLADLHGFRRYLSERLAAVAFNNASTILRAMFRWAAKRQPPLLVRPFHEDPALARKSAKVVKRERRERDELLGVPEYSPAECRALLTGAELRGKHDPVAILLLGMNAGMGAQHIADLPARVIDLDQGRIDWIRTKTEELFAVTLWPLTVAALRRAMAARPKPSAPEYASLALLRSTGRPWVEQVETRRRNGLVTTVSVVDVVSDHLDRLEKRLARPEDADRPPAERQPLKRPRRAFYALRHGFASIADATGDASARRRIMGQSFRGIDVHYLRGAVGWDRLAAVTDHVHRVLFECEPGVLTLENLLDRLGRPAELPRKGGWEKGRPRPELAELNRRRWQDPEWRAAFRRNRSGGA